MSSLSVWFRQNILHSTRPTLSPAAVWKRSDTQTVQLDAVLGGWLIILFRKILICTDWDAVSNYILAKKVYVQYSETNVMHFSFNLFHFNPGAWARYLSRYSDWLRAGRSGNRIPVAATFFAHVQTGPGTHPASCTMGTGSFPGIKRPGRGGGHRPPPSAEVENE
jgi:hypothetical protein